MFVWWLIVITQWQNACVLSKWSWVRFLVAIKYFFNSVELKKSLWKRENTSNVYILYFGVDVISEYEGPSKEIKDDSLVINEISTLAYQWKEIATCLFSNMNDIKRIEQEYSRLNDRLLEVILCWKNHNHPPYTWNTLTEVLQKPSVGRNRIADYIQQKYIRSITSIEN